MTRVHIPQIRHYRHREDGGTEMMCHAGQSQPPEISSRMEWKWVVRTGKEALSHPQGAFPSSFAREFRVCHEYCP